MPEAILTIGMPVYNGERYLARALDSLLNQDFVRWTLLIADNHSSDATRDIAQAYVRQDPRISYVCHEENIGAVNNFLFLANSVKTPYFMWAAADDEWSRNYIACCVAELESDAQIGFVGGGICNIDDQGNHIRPYKAFPTFDERTARKRINRFLLALEADGKANMIYSVFRADLIRVLCRIPRIFDGWGSDMAFVAAALSRARYRQITEASLYKRVIFETDLRTATLLAQQRHTEVQFRGNFPPSQAFSYIRALIRAMPSLGLGLLVLGIMLGRLSLLSIQSAVRRNVCSQH